jgi:hypothetical protein
MTNVEALKALYKALGGDESDVAEINTIADMIAEIATVAATATAPELPAVTAAENGKVLKVVNGKWAVGTDEIQA